MIITRFFLFMVLLGLEAPCLLAQKEDYHWILGYNLYQPTSDTTFGRYELIFSDSTKKFLKTQNVINKLDFTNASISDSSGNLLFYTNGLEVYDRNYHVMPNGDDLNPGEFATANEDLGYTVPGGALILQWPEYQGKYIIIHHKIERDFKKKDYHAGDMLATLVDMNLNNNLGDVVYKNKSFFNDSLSVGALIACRHANGRDWWILCPYYTGKKMFTFLLNPNGLIYYNVQVFPFELLPGPGQSTFSPDGSKYSFVHFTNTNREFLLCDFDRCTGQLTNMQFDYYPNFDLSGVAFSPNSKYLYLSTGTLLFQLNMLDSKPFESKIKIDTIDGFLSIPNPPVPSYLTAMQLAPDGKIYISNGRSPQHLSTIENPDLEGKACDLRQHNLLIIRNSTIPNFPHFRLGALEGSNCDTLARGRLPIADWNSKTDTLNHLRFDFTDHSLYEVREWYWDFGDPSSPGNTSIVQNPEHEFSKDGVYDVCLIVKNKNGADTLCRMLTIATVYADDPGSDKIPTIKLSPNPCKDILTISLLKYNPEKMSFQLYNSLGENVKSHSLIKGNNIINTEDLQSGIYFISILENGIVIKTDKLLKI